MKFAWLLIMLEALYLHPVAAKCNTESQNVVCEETAKNYSSVPSNLHKNVSILQLSNNNIALNENDTLILHNYINMTELYLNHNAIAVLHNYSFCNLSKLEILDVSDNSIKIVEQAALIGLNKLQTLYLQNNQIAQLNSNTFVLLKNLKVLKLQNNLLRQVDIPVSLNLTTITLIGNQWNCSCDLLSLQNWLTTVNVTMENETNTVCTTPDILKTQSIKMAAISDCGKRGQTKAPILISTSFNASNETMMSAQNGTDRRSLNAAPLPLGKSWTFLVGVLVAVTITTLLIGIVIKFPAWYRYLVSYNHSRLDEDEPEMFDDIFTTDTFPQTPEQDSVVVFEQYHTFVPDDDGFIEDKYIDT